MNFSFIKQNYSPLNGYTNVLCSSFLNFKGGVNAIVKRPMFDYSNLKPRFDEKHFQSNVHPFFIHRYMKFSRFNESIDNNNNQISLSFLSPYKWFDPYETLFYEPKINIGGDEYQIACICCCYDDVESEESAWNRNKLTKITDNKTIKISYSMGKLCDFLENAAFSHKELNLKFYFSIVDYSQSKTHLIPRNKPTSYSSIDEYINLMSLKRKAFAYENEIRIFAVVKNASSFYDNNGVFSITCSQNNMPIMKITLPPKNPVLRTEPEFDVYSKMQDVENIDLRRKIYNILPTIQINQSRLYQTGNPTSQWINKYNQIQSVW